MSKATMRAEDTQLTQLVAQGQGVYVSSGDYGAYGDEGNGLNVSDPASQPNVVSVGGTTLYLNNQNLDLYEIVWNTLAGTGRATGGGISTIWPVPGYQINYGAPNFGHVMTVYGGSATMRNVPDVSAVADPITGASIYSRINGGWGVVGGTSLSAPLMAAVGTIGNTASKSLGFNQIGFANPAIYAVMETPITSALVQGDFHDIVDGNNGNIYLYNNVPGFTSGFSYDLASGWGTPNTRNLLLDMALQPVIKNVTPPGPATKITVKATATTITVGWKPAADATGYFVLAYGLLPGADPAMPFVATGNSVLLTGLTSNLEYELAVYSVGPHGYTQSGTYYIVTDKKPS
jgi:subtilase family serine protease